MVCKSNRQHIKVLLVEDNENDYVIIRELLADIEKPQFELEWVSNPETALTAIASQQHDVCLLDYRLGCCNGLELLKYATNSGYQAPIIMLTATADRRVDLEAMESGATDFLNKNEISTNLLERSLRYAIKQKQTEEALRQQAQQERLLKEITQNIRGSLNFEHILETTVVEVRQLLQADRVLIYQFYPDGTGQAIAESVVSGYPMLLEQGRADTIQKNYLLSQQGQISKPTNIQQDHKSFWLANIHKQLNATSKIAVPLLLHPEIGTRMQEELWGLLIVHQYTTNRQWQQTEIDLLKQLAAQVEIAIQQSKLYQHLQVVNQRLERLATLDELTQIANRRYFDLYLRQEWKRLSLGQLPLSLILCDIDYFKKYNDFYGHLAGDACLTEVAQAISYAARRSADLVARYGGEEFAVILPNTDINGAIQVVENIREQIKKLNHPHVVSPVSKQITLSIGVASIVPTLNAFPNTLIEKADQALYQAKVLGRNRYCVAQSVKFAI